MARGTSRAARAPRAAKKPSGTKSKTDDDEPSPRHQSARALRGAGLSHREVARVLAVSTSTARRWLTAPPRGLVSRRRPPTARVVAAAERDIRALHGLVGADSLRRAHAGLSRRVAAELKRTTLTAMERERREAAARVTVLEPGVVRGFDAMHLDNGFALVSADAAVPYRTSIAASELYDGAAVARALEADFEAHGAPLVLRMDRASVHRCPQVTAVLERYRVMVLHGPARHPGFYGQLERQNREHRAWLNASQARAGGPDESVLETLRDAVNERWRRRTLGYQTAGERWRARRRLELDRDDFARRVTDRARQLRSSSDAAILSEDVVTRLAIEHTLRQMNLLRIDSGRRVLGDS